ncbi:E3 ubiquitin-protein ligase TRIM71-like [Acetobacter orientalis]|uniref:E3 ubiquitin-protein ligase TRIM71-like n=1 Tax=Acetobacter orientalis TaxID=146474 RepID=A0A2Z5ZJJ4_9PROT|nr:E3 ubiquitin-protein ligase TRIM71-like [Acetobacter orientalis]
MGGVVLAVTLCRLCRPLAVLGAVFFAPTAPVWPLQKAAVLSQNSPMSSLSFTHLK